MFKKGFWFVAVRRPFFSSPNFTVLSIDGGGGGAVRLFRINGLKALMAAPRNQIGESGRLLRDEENAAGEKDVSPTCKKPKSERFLLSRWEFTAALGIFFIFSSGLFCIYLTMPAADYGKLKLPRTISDLRMLKCVPFSIRSFHFSIDDLTSCLGNSYYIHTFQAVWYERPSRFRARWFDILNFD